jgi:hypothetical protein
MTNDFDEAAVRTSLLKLRTKLGADTPAGHRCSNLLEQLEVRAKATDPDHIRRLEKNIGQSVADLSALVPKGDRQ